MYKRQFLILTGLFKKAIVSDYISLNFVDRIFDEPLLYSGFGCLMGIYGYALQIYCDFSGYSDMAIGLSLIHIYFHGQLSLLIRRSSTARAALPGATPSDRPPKAPRS